MRESIKKRNKRKKERKKTKNKKIKNPHPNTEEHINKHIHGLMHYAHVAASRLTEILIFMFSILCTQLRDHWHSFYLVQICNPYQSFKCNNFAVQTFKPAATKFLVATAILVVTLDNMTTKFKLTGARAAQSVVCWAHCPVWCSFIGLTLLWASGRGDFSLGVNMASDSIPQKLFPMIV